MWRRCAAVDVQTIASLDPKQVAALAPEALAAFSASQLGALSGEAVSQLTAAQLAALSSAQVAAFSAEQLAKLTPAQIKVALPQPAEAAAVGTSLFLLSAILLPASNMEIIPYHYESVRAIRNAHVIERKIVHTVCVLCDMLASALLIPCCASTGAASCGR